MDHLTGKTNARDAVNSADAFHIEVPFYIFITGFTHHHMIAKSVLDGLRRAKFNGHTYIVMKQIRKEM